MLAQAGSSASLGGRTGRRAGLGARGATLMAMRSTISTTTTISNPTTTSTTQTMLMMMVVKRTMHIWRRLARAELAAGERRDDAAAQRELVAAQRAAGLPAAATMRRKSLPPIDRQLRQHQIQFQQKENETEQQLPQRLSQPQSESATSNNNNSTSNNHPNNNNNNNFTNGNHPLVTAVGEGRELIVRTSASEWERALGVPLPHMRRLQLRSFHQQSSPSGMRRTGQPNFSNNQSQNNQNQNSNNQNKTIDASPIHIIVSEAWSWGKFARKLGTGVLVGVLALTGIAVVFDQQGIIKSGAGLAGSAEVEPSAAGGAVRFADVQGVDEAKLELEEVVEFLREPARFVELGGKLPKGVLLYGPPGTGKTHLARAVAGEADVPFFQMSGSEFDELYVGVGARRVRELFAAAKKRAPCIIFIDELDAVGSKRSMKDQSYMRQTLNQLLVELDGFSASEGVIVIAATNTPDSLDKALVRPGRFDRLVPVPLPDVKGRSQILRVHMRGVQIDQNVDPDIIARGTPGFSGADLANLVNQAAIRASKAAAKRVSIADLEWAKDKIIMGSEKKSAVITEENKRLTAYHEGGHTLVALYTPGAMPLHKVTVIPRGEALGVTVQLPEGDKSNYTKSELQAMLDVCMGGRVAEEIIFGSDNVTTGASSDLQKATSIARGMVMTYGMSDKVGLLNYSDDAFEKASSQTKSIIEEEIKSILNASYTRSVNLLNAHKDELHRLAHSLVEYETLTQDEVKVVIKGGDLSHKK